MWERIEKITAYVLLVMTLLCLLPVMYLGRYNHPTGDDYYYGADTHLVWEETGNIFAVMSEAGKGVGQVYYEWQGTYSAMFLMYLAPNIFGEAAYKWVTFGILAILSAGIFFFLKPLICRILKGSVYLWMITASLITLLCVETVPSQGETFFWYNGSMYYTGFLAVTLFFFGTLIRYLVEPKNYRVVILGLEAVFLAGGNYVSLLPTMLIVFLLIPCLIYGKKKKETISVSIVFLLFLIGLAVSAMAPGNAVRQSGMDQSSAVIAIIKSLLQGIRFWLAWVRAEWLLAALILTPFVWKALDHVSIRFSYPILVLGFSYGIFCSMCCPTFYTMNSTGPARAVSIVYYVFMMYTMFSYLYVVGYMKRLVREYSDRKLLMSLQSYVSKHGKKMSVCAVLVGLLLVIGIAATGKAGTFTTVKAVKLLANGEAKAYEEEYRERLLLLTAPGENDVVLPQFTHQPDMLFVGDLEPDPQGETNVLVAKYFRKKSVCVR